jgi:hypothetical protein
MEIERFLQAADALAEENRRTALPVLIQDLSGAVLSRVPENISRALDAVRSAYTESATDLLPPSRRLLLDRLGGGHVTGREVLKRIEVIVGDERTRPEHIVALLGALQEDNSMFGRLVMSAATQLRQLGAAAPTLAFDECEVGVLYPRWLVPDLDEFQAELQKLDRSLRTIIEIVGDTGSPKMSSLSTGSFWVFVLCSLSVGKAVSKAIDTLLKYAERGLKLKKLWIEVQKDELDLDVAKALKERQGETRAKGLEEAKTEMIDEGRAINAARMNELANAATDAVRVFAQLLENGAVIEVSISSSKEPLIRHRPDLSEEEVESMRQFIRERQNLMLETARQHEPQLLSEGSGSENDRPAGTQK